MKMFINCSHKNIIENAYLGTLYIFSFLRVCTYTISIKLIKVVKRENCEFCSIKIFNYDYLIIIAELCKVFRKYCVYNFKTFIILLHFLPTFQNVLIL